MNFKKAKYFIIMKCKQLLRIQLFFIIYFLFQAKSKYNEILKYSLTTYLYKQKTDSNKLL